MGKSAYAAMPAVMNAIPPKAIALSVAAAIAIFILFNLAKQPLAPPSVPSPTWWHKSGSEGALFATQNRTLGVSTAFYATIKEQRQELAQLTSTAIMLV